VQDLSNTHWTFRKNMLAGSSPIARGSDLQEIKNALLDATHEVNQKSGKEVVYGEGRVESSDD
jgi:hypothetical protein